MDEISKATRTRFDTNIESFVEVIAHADRAESLQDYCTGLLLPGERKSDEPLAAVVPPSASRPSINRCCISLVRRLGRMRLSCVESAIRLCLIERQGGTIEAWIVDDTGFAKKGTHSVGVAR